MDTKPWYRQPLVWLLISFPLTAVIAGMITIWLAVTTDDGLVSDDYYWQGKQINRTLARDKRAFALGLSGQLALNPSRDIFTMQLQSSEELDVPEVLNLQFLHSTRAGLDSEILLRHIGDGVYQGVMPELAPGSWHLQLGTDDWRLHGNLFAPFKGTLDIELQATPNGG